MWLVLGEEESGVRPLLRDLVSEDAGIREKAQANLLTLTASLSIESRSEMIIGLTNILKDVQIQGTREDSINRAIFILGEMRVPETIPRLIELIGFPLVQPAGTHPSYGQPVGMGTLRKSVRGTFPAVEALIKIGDPCMKQVIEKLQATNSVLEMKACLGVLLGIKGKASASALIRDAMAGASQLENRERLQNSLEMIGRLE
jgi:hypothetical protein